MSMSTRTGFKPSGFFVLRTPLLPFTEFLKWGEDLLISDQNISSFSQETFERVRQQLRRRLQEIVHRPEIREALFLASPSLEERISKWFQELENKNTKKIENSIINYFSRMTGRATPFGLCAGCSIGVFDSKSQLRVEKSSKYRRHTRLDAGFLYALSRDLQQLPGVCEQLKYYPNASLYFVAGKFRYVETVFEEKIRKYHLVGVESTEYLNSTIALAQEGAHIETLAQALVDEDISFIDAKNYIKALIENQILVSDLEPLVTGGEPVNDLIHHLKKIPSLTPVTTCLKTLQHSLQEIDRFGLGIKPEWYQKIAESLHSLPTQFEIHRLFQVDLFKPTLSSTLGKSVLDEIFKGIEILHLLGNVPQQDNLSRFRESFVKRYGNREIPLCEALDEEFGIGFTASNTPGTENSPLLKGLEFPASTEKTRTWGMKEHFLFEKLEKALSEQKREIRLEQQDLSRLHKDDIPPLPDAFSVSVNIAACSEEELSRGNFRMTIGGLLGPSGVRLLGRFCHADSLLRSQVENHIQEEERLNPDAVYAEVVHIPQGRTGNVIFRPILRSHEIPYLGRSGAVSNQQIPVTDLMVSVVGARVILRSRRLGREVIPRLTSAHNYFSGSLPIYHFLGTLQDQDIAKGLHWNWGIFEGARFLPRVSIGKIVLCRARWRIYREELEILTKTNGVELFRAVQDLRTKRKMPRFVRLSEGDNELPIDFENVLSVENFVRIAKNRNQITLIEMFPEAKELCVTGDTGSYVSEIIVPFVKTKNTEKRESVRKNHNILSVQSNNPIQRCFSPGSEWLYLKLYCSISNADLILRDKVPQVWHQLFSARIIDQWFFIRYSDPDWHLRIRFHVCPDKNCEDVISMLYKTFDPLLSNGLIWRIQLDTYEREIERYGGQEAIEIAEKIFHIDSEAVLNIIHSYPSDKGMDTRCHLALLGIDRLLSDFGFDLQAKYELVKTCREMFGREFRADTTSLRHQLGRKFRQERRSLESLMDIELLRNSPIARGLEILNNRSRRLKPLIKEMEMIGQNGELGLSLREMVPSFTHMFVNRLLRSSQRAQELVLYDFLRRLYDSQIARNRSK